MKDLIIVFVVVLSLLPISLGDSKELLTLLGMKEYWQNPLALESWSRSNSHHCSWPFVRCENKSVTELSLVRRDIAGPVPPFICDLRNLEKLDLSSNRMHFGFPRALHHCRKLAHLDLSDNYFTGTIPDDFGGLSSGIRVLSLGRNRFSGRLPVTIGRFTELTILDVGDNQFCGQVSSLPGRIAVLDLSRNRFSGHIPPQLGRLSLSFLNLSSNRFIGKIPDNLHTSTTTTTITSTSSCFLDNPGLGSHSKPKSKKVLIVFTAVAASVFVLLAFCVVLRWRRPFPVRTPTELTLVQTPGITRSTILAGLEAGDVIGRGGSGQVFRVALEGSPTRFVAVKKIINSSGKGEGQFHAEVNTLSTIRHGNIVKLLCHMFNDKSEPLLVYEYAENGSLHGWLRRRAILDWPKRLKIAVGIARGLSYMHHHCSPPIIHRDVKPSNILLDSQFNAKIADFGFAKMLVNLGESHTMSTVSGTFGYLAPEYASTTRASEKIDVYSFGVVLIELATGKKATDGEMGLADWAIRYEQEGKPTVDVLDAEVRQCYYDDQMISVFQLGIRCTFKVPCQRPSMQTVLESLTSI